mmetsp:Transcript_68900/g.107893  ORF Transcript_68900/g.107893 Transcript_68900/m.107893 type:complete len:313 (-) Transcript_68900:290-1228(-)
MAPSQGRIIVSPTALPEILAALSMRKEHLLAPRVGVEEEGSFISRSASPPISPRPRSNLVPEGGEQQSAPREAWGNQMRGPSTSRSTGTPGHRHGDKGAPRPRGSTSSSRVVRNGAAQTRRNDSFLLDDEPTDWNCTTLFGGERVLDGKAKRSSATVFRRPESSRAPPHQRPIFMSGSDGQDPRMCVDIHAPQRFTSSERTRYEKSWRKAPPAICVDDLGSRAPQAATVASLGTGRATGGGRDSGRRSVCSSLGRRSCTPSRPESAASLAFGRVQAHRPTSMSGHRPPSLCRPTSTTPAQTPPPLAWSGVVA